MPATTPDIRTFPRPDCALCGVQGVLRYQGLRDRLFGAPGEWTLYQCGSAACGLLWLNPMPLPEDIGKAYQSYYTHAQSEAARPLAQRLAQRMYRAVRNGYLRRTYGYRRGVGPAWYRWLAPLAWLHPNGVSFFAAMAMFLPAPAAGSRLLEIGCGNGYLLVRMEHLGWEVEGVDFDPAAVAVAREKGLSVRCGDVHAQGYPDDYFDAVYLGNLIEHIYDPDALLKECRRVLKPHGQLVVLTPNSESWGSRLFGEDWRGLEPPRHLQLFNLRNLGELARKSGFVLQELTSLGRGAQYILSMSYVARQQRLGGASDERALRRRAWLWGWLYQVGESVRLLRDRSVGEEILLIARKGLEE